jgi:RimJ/RimL family protein N-acetyltransferase
LRGATDELLESLVPIVRAGVVDSREPGSFDDPMSLYLDSPEREWHWLQAIWTGRGTVTADWWRLYFVVVVDGSPVGVEDLTGIDFQTTGAVATFSWLASAFRGRGIGTEMRSAILHLAFAGLGAQEARSDAFIDNAPSNAVSRALGYVPGATTGATRRGESTQMQQWTLTRDKWSLIRRGDIELHGVPECLPVLGLAPQDD